MNSLKPHKRSNSSNMCSCKYNSKLYRAWHHMLDYGRSKEWNKFPKFETWAKHHGFNEKLGLVCFRRIDGEREFSPDNTIVTSKIYPNATYITWHGMTMNIAQWARYIGASKQTLTHRLSTGMSVSDALTIPVGKIGSQNGR